MPLSNSTKVYPGDPLFSRIEKPAYDTAGFLDSQVSFGLHTATHIDAPKHFIAGGKPIDAYGLERFSCKGVLVKVVGEQVISKEKFFTHDINRGDAVLIHADHTNKERFSDYFQTNPVLSKEAAEYLSGRRPSIVGIDSFSPDNPPFEAHKVLLAADVLIVENLCNLAALEGKQFKLYVFPLKIAGAEAAPCRAVAEVF